jgi:hypothetical protein
MVRGVRSMVIVMVEVAAVFAFTVVFLFVRRQSRQLHERSVLNRSQALSRIFSNFF